MKRDKIFVLSHRAGRDGNTVLGAFDNWAALSEARELHKTGWPDARLEVLTLEVNTYIFEKELGSDERRKEEPSGGSLAGEAAAVVVASEGREQSDRLRLRRRIHAPESLPADGEGVEPGRKN